MHSVDISVGPNCLYIGLIPEHLLDWLEQYIGPVLSRRDGYAQSRMWKLSLVHDLLNVRILSFVIANKTDAILFKLTWG